MCNETISSSINDELIHHELEGTHADNDSNVSLSGNLLQLNAESVKQSAAKNNGISAVCVGSQSGT